VSPTYAESFAGLNIFFSSTLHLSDSPAPAIMPDGWVWSGVCHEGKIIGMERFGIESDGWGEESVLGGGECVGRMVLGLLGGIMMAQKGVEGGEERLEPERWEK
jgi:hypothetical protein